jgi:AcrR family transcriptional regulator
LAKSDKRESLIGAAATLFHRKGFEHTSLADIAAAADVPLGNVYYYFKTRGDLLKAVTENRIAGLQAHRAELAGIPDVRKRMLAYMDAWESRTAELTAYGCPMGGLCWEANKLGGEAAEEAAAVLKGTLAWVGAQFREMGFGEAQAREHAARLIGARHGSIMLSNTFKDPKYIRLETARLKVWLASLPATSKPEPGKKKVPEGERKRK